MKTCILSVVELKHMVMSSMYYDYFDSHKLDYDIIYLDRYHEKEKSTAKNIFCYEITATNAVNKIIGYFRFKQYAKSILRKNKYDFVAVWNEYTATLFANFLKKYYTKKYSVNIRDLFDPEDKIRRPQMLYPILMKAIKFSAFTTVSSERYLDYLPDYDNYIFVHSINSDIMPQAVKRNRSKNNPIQVLYIGKIGYLEEVEKLLESLGNDSRYIMKFVGIGSEKIKEIADAHGITNVEFIGIFESNQTNSFLQNADILFNLYGDKKACEQTALSNKLYYAVCLHIPILVCKHTYMYEIANSCGIAFPFDDYDKNEVADALFKWYNAIDSDEIGNKCEAFKSEAIKSRSEFEVRLNNVFHNKEL